MVDLKILQLLALVGQEEEEDRSTATARATSTSPAPPAYITEHPQLRASRYRLNAGAEFAPVGVGLHTSSYEPSDGNQSPSFLWYVCTLVVSMCARIGSVSHPPLWHHPISESS